MYNVIDTDRQELVILALPQLAEIRAELAALRDQIKNLEIQSLAEWIDLRQAARLKGVSLSTLQKNSLLQPPHSSRRKFGKSYRWPRNVVFEWLQVSEPDLLRLKDTLSQKHTKIRESA